MITQQFFDNFITRKGDQLYDGDKLYRFVSWNVPNIHMIEDPEWHMPMLWEQEDAMASVAQMQGQVIRTYVLSVIGGKNNQTGINRSHVMGIGEFDEGLFVCLDQVMALAHQYGIRVIFPFVDQASWWGGIEEYAKLRGKTKEAFWTDGEIRGDFKSVIHFLLNRVNTLTGIPYKEDKAILCWETGNEIAGATAEWTEDIAKYIKSLDPNHLVMDGNDHPNPTALYCDDVDIVTSHYYNYSDDRTFVERFQIDMAKTKGIKPFVVGEYGVTDFEDLKNLTEAVVDSPCCGSLIWSLRFHNHEGGFYFHEDGSKPVVSRSYHYPGFVENDDYYENDIIKMIMDNAIRIQNTERKPLDRPNPPYLFPVVNNEITFRGATGATHYCVERSTSLEGPWKVIGEDVSDCMQHGPLFITQPNHDQVVYFYRVFAKNEAGCSEASNSQMGQ